MASTRPQLQGPSGKLVALEGNLETVTTQLRLLPPSQKILVLPSLLDDLPQERDAQSFNARALIRNVHAAFSARVERARSFLQSSTSQPRLVFMNGGSIRARTTCIAKICEHITNGDLQEAERIFDENVEDGMAGLMRLEDAVERCEDADEETAAYGPGARGVLEKCTRPKAMRAADCLDSQNADSETEPIEDNTTRPNVHLNRDRPEANAKISEVQGDFLKYKAGNDIVKTVVTLPRRTTGIWEKRPTFRSRNASAPPTAFTSTASCPVALWHQMEDANDYDSDDDYAQDLGSPGHDSLFSVASTPAILGEACLVDVQSIRGQKKTAKRVRSFDRFYPSNSSYSDWIPGSPLIQTIQSPHPPSRPCTSSGRLQEEQGCQSLTILTRPDLSFMKGLSSTIKKRSVSSESSLSRSASMPQIRVYVDRGTDAEDIVIEDDPKESATFEPVFPLVEDLVIHLDNKDCNEVFEHVISGYKTGRYPILPSVELDSPTVRASPSSHSADEVIMQPISYEASEINDEGQDHQYEIDSSAVNMCSGSGNAWSPKYAGKECAGQRLQPPVQLPTPPPSVTEISDRFCKLSLMNHISMIEIHNSLRSLLNLHFPGGGNRYTQYCYPVSSDMERLWKPVFQSDEISSVGNERETLDQIIAFGCEEGVNKDIFAQVSGQIEKLGMKKDGLNRSARVDLRYLISHAYSNLPSIVENTSDPFSDSEILAAYIVPQIEAYLALNMSTRLLIIHYSSDHLSTMIALRKILGQNIFKIAGILDSQPSNLTSIELNSRRRSSAQPHTYSQSQRMTAIVSHNTTHNSSNLAQTKKRQSTVSFSKADYLLPSPVTDAEISTFLSSICQNLMAISTFYTPEPEPKHIRVEKPPTIVTSTFYREASYPASSYNSSRESKIARLTGNPGNGGLPTALSSSLLISGRSENGSKSKTYAQSLASTVKTQRTTTSEGVRRKRMELEKEWENFYIGDEDSEDDDWDRMVLGRELAKIVPEFPVVDRKIGNKQKALKWLGLS